MREGRVDEGWMRRMIMRMIIMMHDYKRCTMIQ